MSDNANGDTGSGFIVGTDPPKPQQAADWPTQTPAQSVSQPVQVVEPPPVQPTGRAFTTEDIERARQQEKDKLYPRLSTMEEELKALRAEREAEQAEKQRLASEAEEARRAKEEGEMEVRSLLEKRESEWNNRFTSLEQQREQDRAVWERENQLRDLEDYKRARLDQEAEFIIPELRDYVTGVSETEIDASIESVKQRTKAILDNMFAAAQQQAPPPRGAAPTAPPVGPMEQQQTYEQLTPDDIRSMSMEDYKRYRQGLLEASGRQFRGR